MIIVYVRYVWTEGNNTSRSQSRYVCIIRIYYRPIENVHIRRVVRLCGQIARTWVVWTCIAHVKLWKPSTLFSLFVFFSFFFHLLLRLRIMQHRNASADDKGNIENETKICINGDSEQLSHKLDFSIGRGDRAHVALDRNANLQCERARHNFSIFMKCVHYERLNWMEYIKWPQSQCRTAASPRQTQLISMCVSYKSINNKPSAYRRNSPDFRSHRKNMYGTSAHQRSLSRRSSVQRKKVKIVSQNAEE